MNGAIGCCGAGWVFAMDALLKFCLQGWKSYWRSILNKFDFVITLLIVALHFFSFFYQNARPWYVIFTLQRLVITSLLILIIIDFRMLL
jgi:two pore calcium channel protein